MGGGNWRVHTLITAQLFWHCIVTRYADKTAAGSEDSVPLSPQDQKLQEKLGK